MFRYAIPFARFSVRARSGRRLPGRDQRPPAQDRFVARDSIWRCTDTACVSTNRTSTRPAIVCAALARQVGALRSFTVDGRAFGAEETERPATGPRAAQDPGAVFVASLMLGTADPILVRVLRQYELVEKVKEL